MSDVPVTQTTSLSRLPSTKAALYQRMLALWDAQITALTAQLTKLMESPVESYSFSGGEGQQSAKRRDLEQVQSALSRAEKEYQYYWNRLNGYGNMTMTLRRR